MTRTTKRKENENISPYNASFPQDMHLMHNYFGVHEALMELPPETLKAYLKFRIDFLQEELDEIKKAFIEKDAEEVVDGLIDLTVVAVGTLDTFDVDAATAWHEVFNANMQKKPGVNLSRPNEFGLPDLIKPIDWVKPSHEGNHGILPTILTAY